jgi:flagellar protein FliO/FliZ
MLGFEVSPIVQYVVAFAIIAILLALFAIVLKRIGGNRFAMSGGERGRGRQPRLGIVDVYDLDRQRQLVLLRRDNVEHLVMLGGANDFVVESNIVRMPASRAMAPQAQMQPGYAPHGAAPVPGPEAGQERAPMPEVGYAPQPVAPAPMPAQPTPPQQPEPLQGYPQGAHEASQGAHGALHEGSHQGAPPRAAPQPVAAPTHARPNPAEGISPSDEAAAAQVLPEPDALRAGPRPEEPPQQQKRGLFGFARSAGQETTPGGQVTVKGIDTQSDKARDKARDKASTRSDDRRDASPADSAPQFPPRSRATPVAPPTPSPYPPRRTAEPARPASDVTAGLAAALAAGGNVAAAAAARSGTSAPASSAEAAVADAETSQPPAKDMTGSQATAIGTPDLQQALLSDMEKELEAAFQRQAAAVSTPGTPPEETAPEKPVEPSAETPPPAPAFPTRSGPAVPDPVAPSPDDAAIATQEARGGTDAARTIHPHVPEPGMTPPPSTGPAYFAPVVDEAIPPQEERQVAHQHEPHDVQHDAPHDTPQGAPQGAPHQEHRDPGFPGEHAQADETGFAPEPLSDEATSDSDSEEEAFGKVIGGDEAVSAPPPMEEPPVDEPSSDEPRFAGPSTMEPAAQAPTQESVASEEPLQDQGPPPTDAEPEQDVPEETAEEAVEEAAEAVPEESTEEPAPIPDEPKSKVDPFSVDEIEAEFARLLGRSVDKDPKSS